MDIMKAGKGKYEYRIGVCALRGQNKGTSIPGLRHPLSFIGINHHCLLLENDIFEYGKKGYKRRRNVGMIKDYDWYRKPIIAYNEDAQVFIGRTNVSPDDLEEIIDDSNKWTDDEYDFMSHNCQNFVRWCINQIKTH